MTSRFDNLAMSQLLGRHADAEAECAALAEAIKAKFIAECLVKTGKVYLIRPNADAWRDLYGKRHILVRYIIPDYQGTVNRRWVFTVQGVLRRAVRDPKRRGYCKGLFASKHVSVPASRIDLSTESDPPEAPE